MIFFCQKMSPASQSTIMFLLIPLKLQLTVSFLYVKTCACVSKVGHKAVRRQTANALKRGYLVMNNKHRIARFLSIRSELLNQISLDLGTAIVGLLGTKLTTIQPSDHAVDPPEHASQVPAFKHQEEHCVKTNLPSVHSKLLHVCSVTVTIKWYLQPV